MSIEDVADTHGAKVADLTRSGDLAPLVDALLAPVEAERDAYREIAIEKERALREVARLDVESEATRRESRAHLRSI